MPGNDGFTKILLHFNGADGGTVITDDNAGGSSHTWTANGNANTDTGIVKFGSAALLCDGAGDYVTTPDHADFTLGSSDWVADVWFNIAGGSGSRRFLYGQNGASPAAANLSISLELNASNVLAAGISNGASIVALNGSTSLTTAGWRHVALLRSGNVIRMFLNGVQEGSDLAFAGSVPDVSTAWAVGRTGELTTLTWNGSLDEFRLSVGTDRGWSGGFTPPTEEYDATGTGQPLIKRLGGVPFVGKRGVW